MSSLRTNEDRRARHLLLAGPALAVAIVATGCGYNRQEPSPPQATATTGKITVQSMYVVPPTGKTYAAGSSATAQVLLINSGRDQDVLLGASSPRAGSALVQLDGVTTSRLTVLGNTRSSQGIAVVLQRLTDSVAPGSTVPVTLRFATASAVTLNVPVRAKGS